MPGKPLLDLLGIPMVVRTYRQVVKAVEPERVFVATESEKIKEVCESFNIKVLMTSDRCLTGTDRIAECARQLPEINAFINVQGDEPVFEPADITAVIEASAAHPEEIINGYCEISTEHQFYSGSVPKVVFRPDGRLLYMSRAGIPSDKSHQFNSSHRQVCCYAFPLKALEAFARHGQKTALEQIEDIEILRFLELGYDVRMISLSSRSIAVDVPDDIPAVEAAIRARGL